MGGVVRRKLQGQRRGKEGSAVSLELGNTRQLRDKRRFQEKALLPARANLCPAALPLAAAFQGLFWP